MEALSEIQLPKNNFIDSNYLEKYCYGKLKQFKFDDNDDNLDNLLIYNREFNRLAILQIGNELLFCIDESYHIYSWDYIKDIMFIVEQHSKDPLNIEFNADQIYSEEIIVPINLINYSNLRFDTSYALRRDVTYDFDLEGKMYIGLDEVVFHDKNTENCNWCDFEYNILAHWRKEIWARVDYLRNKIKTDFSYEHFIEMFFHIENIRISIFQIEDLHKNNIGNDIEDSEDEVIEEILLEIAKEKYNLSERQFNVLSNLKKYSISNDLNDISVSFNIIRHPELKFYLIDTELVNWFNALPKQIIY